MSWYTDTSHIPTTYERWGGQFPRFDGGAVFAGAYVDQSWRYFDAAYSPSDYRPVVGKFDSFNVAVAGILYNEQIQQASWTLGRSDWWSTLSGSSASLTFKDGVDAKPGDSVSIHDTYDSLFAGYVSTVRQSQDINGNIFTTITAQDIVGRMGQVEFNNASFAAGTVDSVITAILTAAGLPGRVEVVTTFNPLPTLEAITGYTGSALALINRIEQSSNTLVFAQPDGTLSVMLRDALADYGARVLSGKHAPIPNSHWDLDEPSGNVTDSRSVATGTVSGTLDYQVEGPFGAGSYAIEFDGTNNESISFGDVYDFTTRQPFTILGWIRWDGTQAGCIIDKRDTGSANGYSLQVTSDGRLKAVRAVSGVEVVAQTSADVVPSDGSFLHVGMVYDGNGINIVASGASEAATTDTRNLSNHSSPLMLGRLSWANSERFDGALSQFSLWDGKALSTEQIVRLISGDSVLLDDDNAPSTWELSVSDTGIINAWNLSNGASAYLSDSYPVSIARYGKRDYSINDYIPSGSVPFSSSLRSTMAEPRTILDSADFKVFGYQNKAHILRPLDLITRNDKTLQVMSVAHSVDLSQWRVSLTGDLTASALVGEVLDTGDGEPVVPPEPAPPGFKRQTLTYTADRDAVAFYGGSSAQYGSGKGDWLPVGLWQGKKFRTFIHFPINFPSDTTRVVKATLQLKTSSQFHMAFGNPKFYVKRVTESWSEGTQGSDNQFHFNNSLRWDNQPGVTNSGQKLVSFGDAENYVRSITITEIAQSWLEGSNHGLRLSSNNESSTSNNIEFRSRENSGPVKITIVIERPA